MSIAVDFQEQRLSLPRPEIDADLLEKDRLARTFSYSTTSERAFDDAIARQDIGRAQVIITELMDAQAELAEREIYTAGMFHTAIKELAMPLYIRAQVALTGESYPDEEMDVSSVYGDSVLLLEYLKAWFDPAHMNDDGSEESERTMRGLKGDLGELTFFAVMSRELRGTPEDELNIVPPKQTQDMGQREGTTGLKYAVDFFVSSRRTHKKVPTQVKVGDHEAEMYSPEIMMVVMQRIAGGTYRDVNALQLALIAEVHGHATKEQVKRIERVSRTLHKKFYQRLAQPAMHALAS